MAVLIILGVGSASDAVTYTSAASSSVVLAASDSVVVALAALYTPVVSGAELQCRDCWQ